MQAQSLGWKDPLEEGMATHSSIFAWRITWTEEPGGLLSKGLQRVRHNWSDLACMHTVNSTAIGNHPIFSWRRGMQRDELTHNLQHHCRSASVLHPAYHELGRRVPRGPLSTMPNGKRWRSMTTKSARVVIFHSVLLYNIVTSANK